MILLITVNYNNANLTNKMIESISSSDVKIIVVDNNSDDKELLRGNDKTEFLFLKNNIGYFPAINEALKQKQVSEYDYVIICNNDLEFDKNFFSQLDSSDYEDDVFAICPRIIDLDNLDQNPMIDKKISRFKLFWYTIYYNNYILGLILYSIWQKLKSKSKKSNLVSRRIFMGYGAIYILTKTFFKNNKLLESPNFLMFEETFLAYQIFKTKGIEYYDSKLIVHHKDHSSCSKIPKRRMYDICKSTFGDFKQKVVMLPKIQ